MPTYKDNKKGTWYCKFRYTDWQGNRKETTKRGFQTKREAKKYELEFIRKAQGTADMTLRSLYEIYLEDRKKQVKQSSLLHIKNTIDTYILPTLGDKPITEITPNAIRQWQNHLVTLGKKAGGNLQPATLLTINRRLSALLNSPPKTKSSERTIIIPDIAVKALTNVCEKLPDTKRIFPVTYVSAGEYYRKIAARAGVRYLPIHSLRHSHASMLIANGIPITAVSKRLGHSSPQVTLSIYAHALSDSEQSIVDKLNSL